MFCSLRWKLHPDSHPSQMPPVPAPSCIYNQTVCQLTAFSCWNLNILVRFWLPPNFFLQSPVRCQCMQVLFGQISRFFLLGEETLSMHWLVPAKHLKSKKNLTTLAFVWDMISLKLSKSNFWPPHAWSIFANDFFDAIWGISWQPNQVELKLSKTYFFSEELAAALISAKSCFF